MPMRKDAYPSDWPKISRSVRERAGQKCQRCGVANGAVIFRSVDGQSWYDPAVPVGTGTGVWWRHAGRGGVIETRVCAAGEVLCGLPGADAAEAPETGATATEGVVGAKEALIAERDRLRAALQQIREQSGRVCDGFELCAHESCRSSYAAWSLADEALKGVESNG